MRHFDTTNREYHLSVSSKGINNKMKKLDKDTEAQKQPKQLKTTKRGKVKTLSLASVRRLREFLYYHDFQYAHTFHVTLTYRKDVDHVTSKQHLDDLFKTKLKRAVFCAVWRMEVTKRGRIHYHLIFNCNDAQLILKLSRGWQDLTGNHHEQACKFSVYEKSLVEYYLTSHTGKKGVQVAANMGRHWGVVNRKQFLEDDISTEVLNYKQAMMYFRALGRLVGFRLKSGTGFLPTRYEHDITRLRDYFARCEQVTGEEHTAPARCASPGLV